jgi:hypothetical protein
MLSRKVLISCLVAIAALSFLSFEQGCASKPQLETETEQPPPRLAVSDDPLEELTVPQFQEEEPAQIAIGAPGKLYSLRVRKGELHDVLLGFAQESGENLVIDPEVAGIVTMNLNRVTLEQALDALLTPLGFTDFEAKDGNPVFCGQLCQFQQGGQQNHCCNGRLRNGW